MVNGRVQSEQIFKWIAQMIRTIFQMIRKYIFNLLLSIINMSMQTVNLVNSLPSLDIMDDSESSSHQVTIKDDLPTVSEKFSDYDGEY